MRPSATTDAGADRFSAGNEEARPVGSLRKAIHSISAFWLALSPVTITVGVTTLACATLFTIFDISRTLDEARSDLRLVGQLITAGGIDPAIAGTISPSIMMARAGGRSGGPIVIEHRVPTPDGRVLTLSAPPQSALAGIAPRAAAAYGLALLVTAASFRRRRPEPVIDPIDSNDVERLVAAMPQGMACWTAEGRLISANQLYWDAIGTEKNAAISYHEAVKKLIRGGYMKLVTNSDKNRQLELHRDDGSCLLIDERPFGRTGFVTLVADVTERKRTDALLVATQQEQKLLARRYHEEKLKAEAASRAKTNFLAHLSHDIRTPLNHIIGFAELIRHQTFGPVGDQRYVDYVQSIKTSGENLLASFATILDLAELESGQKGLRSDPLPVDDLLDEVVQRFKGQAQRARLRIIRGEPVRTTVHGDRLGIVRMLSNIVENALRFTPSGGKITIAAFAARDGVVVEITDTGIGMSEERLDALSQPFALGDATFTRDGGGSGLGISIARAIAELSGGHLAIDSSPSLGTTVAISLPLRETATAHAAE